MYYLHCSDYYELLFFMLNPRLIALLFILYVSLPVQHFYASTLFLVSLFQGCFYWRPLVHSTYNGHRWMLDRTILNRVGLCCYVPACSGVSWFLSRNWYSIAVNIVEIWDIKVVPWSVGKLHWQIWITFS